jgi:hypothetical protein
MSNDRFWIVCGICQRCKFVGKYYPGTGGVVDNPEKMIAFIEHHVMEHSGSDIEHRLEFVSEAQMHLIAHTLKDGPTYFQKPPGVE